MSTNLERTYPTINQLGGVIHNVRRLVDPNIKEWSATNLSIGYHKSTGYIGMFRSGNYVITEQGEYKVVVEGLIKSRIYISELNPATYKLTNVRLLDVKNLSKKGEIRRGLEDPKVFYRDGAWHFTAVTMEKGHTEKARMAICRLNKDLTEIESFEKLLGIDGIRPEKNWMTTYDRSPYFDWVYGTNALVKENVLTTYLQDNDQIAGLRGSSNLHLLKDGTYLAVVHRMWTRVVMNHTLRFYVHYFANYDERGKIIGISKGFIFEQMGVEFAAGLCEQGDNFLVSYGSKDVSSHIASIPKETVLKSLQLIRTKI
jgi:hypothetical protein